MKNCLSEICLILLFAKINPHDLFSNSLIRVAFILRWNNSGFSEFA